MEEFDCEHQRRRFAALPGPMSQCRTPFQPTMAARRLRDDAPPNPAAADWWFNDEAVRNFGYMQMKKTHDAAMVIVERMYGERPRFNYYIGNSQGGREALTVAQRYSADYDGILATVPVISLSSLQLAPVRIRIQEKPQANWVTPAKTKHLLVKCIS